MMGTALATTAEPYRYAADTYRRAGWLGVLPVPLGQKSPVPVGWTGNHGRWPSPADIADWVAEKGAGNIALRLPPDVLGIDVDAYDDKHGGDTLAALEAKHGPLPATWKSTSRDDGISGIRLFRIPEGLRWPSILGPGIEVVRWDHRYCMAWPSVHPKGGVYRWMRPDGSVAPNGVVPRLDDLPELPHAWVLELTHGELAPAPSASAHLGNSATLEWLGARGGPGTAPCDELARALTEGCAALTTGGARYDAAVKAAYRLVRIAGQGHTGAYDALGVLADAYRVAVGTDRTDDDIAAELVRMITGAVRKVAADLPSEWGGDPCDLMKALAARPTSSATDVTSMTSVAQDTIDLQPTGTTYAVGQTLHHAAWGAGQVTEVSSNGTHTVVDFEEVGPKSFATLLVPLSHLPGAALGLQSFDGEKYAQDVREETRKLHVRRAAAAAYQVQMQPEGEVFDAGLLVDILRRPCDPPMRVEGIVPSEASTLIVAQRKTGKTILVLNLTRALITGEDFLGRFAVRRIAGRVALLNYEVSAAMISRWADDVGVPSDRLLIVNLRGRVNPLGNPQDRARLAALLREQEVEVVAVDTFTRAFTGVKRSDSGEVGGFLVELDYFARTEVGASDLILTTHAGWNGERSRDSSALEDWPDSIITLTRDAEDESQRYLKAIGRDVEVEEDQLLFHEPTRGLTLSGTGSRRQVKSVKKSTDLAVYVRRAAGQQPGASTAAIVGLIRAMEDAPPFQDREVSKAARLLVEKGLLRVVDHGAGKAKQHFQADPVQPCPTPSRNSPQTTPSTPSL